MQRYNVIICPFLTEFSESEKCWSTVKTEFKNYLDGFCKEHKEYKVYYDLYQTHKNALESSFDGFYDSAESYQRLVRKPVAKKDRLILTFEKIAKILIGEDVVVENEIYMINHMKKHFTKNNPVDPMMLEMCMFYTMMSLVAGFCCGTIGDVALASVK